MAVGGYPSSASGTTRTTLQALATRFCLRPWPRRRGSVGLFACTPPGLPHQSRVKICTPTTRVPSKPGRASCSCTTACFAASWGAEFALLGDSAALVALNQQLMIFGSPFAFASFDLISIFQAGASFFFDLQASGGDVDSGARRRTRSLRREYFFRSSYLDDTQVIPRRLSCKMDNFTMLWGMEKGA
jgi:hypothetical protein